MAGEWKEEPFPDVIDFQEDPGILAKDFREAGVPLVRLSGLDRGGSVLEGCNYLDPEAVAKKWAHFGLAKGDILLSTSASLGRIAVVGEDGAGAIPYTGIIRMRPRDARLVADFIRYLLEGPDFQRQAEMVGAGSVIRHFGPMHLRQMTVRLPPPDEQRAIAHILGTLDDEIQAKGGEQKGMRRILQHLISKLVSGAWSTDEGKAWLEHARRLVEPLDDKIELNRRMNETLEAMARALFKSWFVDFDPVRWKMERKGAKAQRRKETDKNFASLRPGDLALNPEILDLFPDSFVDSELGQIPKGWEVGRIKDCCAQIQNGGTPSRKEPRFWENGEIPWLTSAEVRQPIITNTENFITEAGLEKSSAKWVPPLSTVVALYGATAGQVSLVSLRLTTNQAVCALVPKKDFEFFNYLWMRSATPDLENKAVGSAQQNISKAIVEDTRILLASQLVLAKFNETVRPLFARWIFNLCHSRTLAALRDALLPRLISGELRVKDAEKFLKERGL